MYRLSDLKVPGSLLLLGLLAAPVVHAGDDADDRVRTLLKQAQQSAQHHRLEEALQRMQAAYAIKPLSKILLNIGQLQRRLGRDADAAPTLELYLAQERSPPPGVAEELRAYLQKVRGGQATAGSPPRPQPEPEAPRPPGLETPPAEPAPPLPERAPAEPGRGTATLEQSDTPDRSPLLIAPHGAPERAGRPAWVLGLGVPLVTVGVIAAGLGISALAVNGQCSFPVTGANPGCVRAYDTSAAGAGLLGAGAAVALGGALVIALGSRAHPPRATTSRVALVTLPEVVRR